jgi:hypothetical protein
MWVLGTWIGEFNGTIPSRDSAIPGFARDTAMLVGEGTSMMKPGSFAGCGFTALRVRIDNPGAWFFHCHIDYHMEMGMGVVFYTPADTLPAPDLKRIPTCGLATSAVIVSRALQEAQIDGVNSALRPGNSSLDPYVTTSLLVLLCCIIIAVIASHVYRKAMRTRIELARSTRFKRLNNLEQVDEEER